MEQLLHEARSRDIAALYLLTVTEPECFPRYGFKRMKTEDAPQALKASAEFQGTCPACAELMVLTLREAAVAQLIERGLTFVALEAGERVDANLLNYGHVQLFSPSQYDVDHAMPRLLAPTGWTLPLAAELPRAGEIVERVLQPFAALSRVAPSIKPREDWARQLRALEAPGRAVDAQLSLPLSAVAECAMTFR